MLCNYTNPCGDPCCTSCQQSLPVETTTTTTTLCPDAILCDNAYALNCLIYNGPDYPCYGVKNGDSALDIIKIILGHFNPVCNPTTTTTSTTSTTTTSTSSTTTTTTAAPGSLVCNRPLGLLTTKLIFGYGSSIFSLSDFRTQSVSGVCSEFQIFKSSAQSSVSLLNSLLGQTTSVAVGNTLYNGNTDRSCTYVPEGNYWYLPSLPITGSSSALIYSSPTIKIVTVGTNGLITNISDCTYIPPTTTSTSTTSTTTTSTSTTSTTSTSTSTTTTTTLAPCNLTVSDFGVVANSTLQSRAVFSWTNVGTPITVLNYTLEYKLGSSSTWLPVGVGTYQSAFVTLSGLSAGTLYNARIRANAVNSTSCPWVTISFSTLPITTSTTTSTTSTTTTTTLAPVYRYAPYQYQCKTDTDFGIVKIITGLSSPYLVWYDNAVTAFGRKRVWVADVDNVGKGNIYWFNPSTATNEADMTYYDKFKCGTAYICYIDAEKEKIYFTGYNISNDGVMSNGGLAIFDMSAPDSQAVRHRIISYGTDQVYSRQFLFVSSDSVYTTSLNGSSVDVYKFTREGIYTSTTIPTPINVGNNTHFTVGNPQQVGDKIWIVAGTGSASQSAIKVYNPSTLAVEATITIPGAATVPVADWYSGRSPESQLPTYWQFGFYDADYNKYYVCDIGGKTLYVVTPNTSNYTTIVTANSFSIDLRPFSEDKKYIQGTFSLDPSSAAATLDQKLYMSTGMFDTIAGGRTFKTYEINRSATSSSNFFIKIVKDNTYTSSNPVGQTFSNLVKVDANDTNGNPYVDAAMGANMGLQRWSGVNTASTDGSITILSNKVGGDNTGIKQLVKLKKVKLLPNGTTEDVRDTNNNLITALVNDSLDAPILENTVLTDIEDLTACPLTNSTGCPIIRIKLSSDTLYYELSIPTAVRKNTAITKIEVYAGARSGSTTTIVTGPTKVTHVKQSTGNVNYYSGQITITGYTSVNDIVVKYLNSADAQVGSNCSKLF